MMERFREKQTSGGMSFSGAVLSHRALDPNGSLVNQHHLENFGQVFSLYFSLFSVLLNLQKSKVLIGPAG